MNVLWRRTFDLVPELHELLAPGVVPLACEVRPARRSQLLGQNLQYDESL
jgi:hypothetical protein